MGTTGKAFIDDADVAGQRVLVRVDFNVPFKGGEILDDRRIREAVPTIESLRERGARVVLMSHLGRPKGRVAPEYSTRPLAARLSEIIGAPVPVAEDVAGPSARQLAESLEDGDVMMVENVRFEPGEEANDPELAGRMAALADLYCNDAFGAAHRAHASTAGVADHLPAYAGRLMVRELAMLGSALEKPQRPFVAIVGGAKISSKIGVIDNLLTKVDTLWVGGAMACTFYLALGVRTGRSLVEPEEVETASRLLEEAKTRGAELLLPTDVVVAPAPEQGVPWRVVDWRDIPDDLMVVDAGPDTSARIARCVESAGTVVWNGPLGIYELEDFAAASRRVAEALGRSRGVTVTGGGDLTAAIEYTGVGNRITHMSTGGGATLEFLEGRTLPGVAALRDADR